MKDARLLPIPGHAPRPPSNAEKLLQAAHGLSDAALIDCFRVMLDRYDAVALEQLGNEIGRISHEKNRRNG